MSSTVSMVNGGACALHGITGATLRLEWYAGNLDTVLKVKSSLFSSSLQIGKLAIMSMCYLFVVAHSELVYCSHSHTKFSTGFQRGRDENGPPTQNSNFFSIGTQCSNSDNRIQDCGSIGTTSSCTCGEDCYGWLNCRSGIEKLSGTDVKIILFSFI